jgi:FtsP/CotA-like multicopper oxidase with cupredoxin domain
MIFVRTIFLLGTIAFAAASAHAQSPAPPPSSGNSAICPRGTEGSAVPEPDDLRSKNGLLRVELTFHSEIDSAGRTNFCYLDQDGRESPNLRLHPGDTLILTLKNEASAGAAIQLGMPGMQKVPTAPTGRPSSEPHNKSASTASAPDECAGGAMTLLETNLHFHGLTIPPVCHQDETLKTRISPLSAPFEYRFQIPIEAPPGLYWYHPHPHGFSKAQVQGGASGALIIEGVEQEVALVAGLPERVLIIRDQDLSHPDAQPVKAGSMPPPIVLRDAEGDILNSGTGTGKPARDLSLNFVPVPFPQYEPAVIKIKPEAKEFWRVLNASAITYLDLQLLADGKPQIVGVVSLDGIPVHQAGKEPLDVVWRSHLLIPPAGRAEFIVKGPAIGTQASFVTRTVDTGPAGENDPTRPLAVFVAASDAPELHSILPGGQGLALAASAGNSFHAATDPVTPAVSTPAPAEPNPHWVGNFPAVHERKLYFSEEPEDPSNPNSPTKFFVTVEGQKPKQFDMNDPTANIVVQQGDVEEWTIENRSRELHAFHIHQIHFQLMEWNGVPLDEPFLRDTINVPYWDGSSPQYPSVKLKMDFRDPRIVGTFVYHCHVLEHEDGGMMGTVRVERPAKP